jgi:hypothetical protein
VSQRVRFRARQSEHLKQFFLLFPYDSQR